MTLLWKCEEEQKKEEEKTWEEHFSQFEIARTVVAGEVIDCPTSHFLNCQSC